MRTGRKTRSRSMVVTSALARANACVGVWCDKPLAILQELFRCSVQSIAHGRVRGSASMPFFRAQLDELLGLVEGGIRKLLELQQKYVEL